MCFGKRGKRIRHELAKKQGFRCAYCGRLFGARGTPLAATIEHRKAKMDGGTNARENLMAACRHCNQHRGRQMNKARQLARAQQGLPNKTRLHDTPPPLSRGPAEVGQPDLSKGSIP